MVLWNTQTTAADTAAFEPNDTVVALITLPFTVDPNAPPSPPFTPAPPPVVTPPPPPPPPAWQLIQPQFFRLGDQLRVCDVDGKCILLGTAVKP
jgi:hypothetical protein